MVKRGVVDTRDHQDRKDQTDARVQRAIQGRTDQEYECQNNVKKMFIKNCVLGSNR